jgi:glycosyltransferase involved in cell wall biosynthesis
MEPEAPSRSGPALDAWTSGRRVLWLIKGLDRGGAEGLLSLMSRFADRRAFRYEVAYLVEQRRTLVGELRSRGIPVHCLKSGREWNLGWAVRLRHLLKAQRYDVVHIHSPYVAGIARLVVRSLPATYRPALIYTEHLPWSGYVVPTRVLNALTYPLDDVHIAVSEAVRHSIPAWVNGTVRVIRNGIDIEQVHRHAAARSEARSELSVSPTQFLVGTVANFRPQKRYPDLLRAAGLLISRGVDVRFLAVGHGPQEAELLALHRGLGLGARFLFLGRREDPARILAACDAFVLASDVEGLPLAMLEALALGLPVVATAVEGVTECVRHEQEALLVPPRRPDLLADAVETLARDPDRRSALALRALERSRTFSIAEATASVEAVYREVVR